MRRVWSGKVRFACSVLFVMSGIGQSPASAATALSAAAVVEKAVARAQRAGLKAGQPGYTYTKVTLTEELDALGNVKERKEKLYQVSFQAGSTHLKLLEVNGH